MVTLFVFVLVALVTGIALHRDFARVKRKELARRAVAQRAMLFDVDAFEADRRAFLVEAYYAASVRRPEDFVRIVDAGS
jgi:hypothetical protein